MIYHLSGILHKFGLWDLMKFRGCVSAIQIEQALCIALNLRYL